MLEWFNAQEATVKVAIIGLCSAVLVAIITGAFSLSGKKGNSQKSSTYTVNQSATGQNNTQIGVQNNFKEEDK